MLFGVVASSVYDEQKQQTMATTMRICKAQCNNTKQYSLIKKVKQEQVLVHKPASTYPSQGKKKLIYAKNYHNKRYTHCFKTVSNTQ